MTISYTKLSEINGVIDTSASIIDNISTLATASGCFVTWDPNEGKWSIILNDVGTSIKTFDDSNIIGEITLSSSGVNELYNSATIEFPHKDLRDSVDIVTVSISNSDRYPQELDNNLDIKLQCINDPVQAQLIVTRELKQSRVDKIIRFATDYTSNGIKAGDLISVTASMYGFSSKIFRIISIEEEDTDGGSIAYAITALEYDADVYSTAGLTRETKTKRTGIIPKISNEAIATADDVDIGKQIARLLGANVLLGLLNGNSNPLGGLLKNIFGVDPTTGQISSRAEFNDAAKQKLVESISAPSTSKGTLTVSKSADSICDGSSVTFSVASSCSSCFFDNPQFTYPYEITGVLENESSVPLTGSITISGTSPTALVATITHGQATTQTITFTCAGTSLTVDVVPQPTKYISSVSASPSTITEGSGSTVTVATVGYANGETVAYTITGSGTGKVSSPALSGTVTINSNSATLNISTTDDSAYGTSQSILVTVGTAVSNPCVISDNTASITIENNASTGPIPPNVDNPADNFCDYVLVPVVWCGRYDANTNYLKSISARKYAYLPRAPVGGVTVPTSLTVTSPGTSSAAITIGSTVNIDNVSGAGGAKIDVITSFDPPTAYPDTLVTGTTSTFNGYW